MLTRTFGQVRRAATVAAVVLSVATHVSATVTPRIVNGLDTQGFPTSGALLYGAGGMTIDGNDAITFCSGTLIGCHSFLTAAHCVASDLEASHYAVYLQHGGIIPVATIAVHPDYNGASGRDVAVVSLAADVAGIAPTPINATHDLAAIGGGLSGTIVGFGLTAITARDVGIKRYGAVQTADCVTTLTGGEGNDKLVCWDFAIPVGPPGEDSDTCNGDSGGPLFMDFGTGPEVVGVTSTGSSLFCRPLDHAWDASVYYNATWIESAIAGDSTTTCGGIDAVGAPSVTVYADGGILSGTNLSDEFTIDAGIAPTMLRFTLNGIDNGFFNPDLYVKAGPGAGPASYDCKANGLSVYGACVFASPAPGTWSVFVADAAGAGQYQLTTTVFAATALCGNGIVDTGEQCDAGAANGSAGSCCSATCSFAPSGTPCADDGDVCTSDVCDGSNAVCRHPPLPDTDADGTCNAVDACTNVGAGQSFITASHPKIVLDKINTDPTAGNDTLSIKAGFALASGDTFAGIDPALNGARVVVTNSAATTPILDVTLDAGVLTGNGSRGWTLNGSHTVWTFKDMTGAPANGINWMQITDLGAKGARQVGVEVTGKNGTYPAVPGDEPLRATIVLGDQHAAEAGYCGESAFATGDCSFDAKGDTLTCKQ